jgi:hypothetical protein
MRATEGMIAILVGVILVFTVIIPILNDGILGTAYYSETSTNSTEAALVQIYSLSHYPVVTSYVQCFNTTGSDVTAQIAWTGLSASADTGVYRYTNATSPTVALECDYRATGTDSSYISNSTARGVAHILPTLVVVLIIVALAAMIYIKRD